MTLTVLDVEQGTEAWHDARRGMVTASTVGRLITPATIKPASNDESRALTRLLAAERITGWTDPTYQSDDMFRGVMEEPRARDWYGEHHAPVTTCGFMVRDDWGFEIGLSPDGLVGDDGLLEVKAPRQKEHLRTVLADEVPAQYVAQCQAALLVSGREWLDYLSWCGGMAPFVKRVTPQNQWFDAILSAVESFEVDVWSMTSMYRRATEGLPATERIDYNIVELKL